MTKSRNGCCFSGEFFTANGAFNYCVIRACVFAIGSNVIFNSCFAFGMTESIHCCCYSGELSATNRTVNYCLVRACVFAIGSNVVFNFCFAGSVICKRKCNFFSINDFTTNGTVNYAVVRSCNLTCRVNAVFFNCFAGSVICKRKLFFGSANFFATIRICTINYFIIATGSNTCSINYIFSNCFTGIMRVFFNFAGNFEYDGVNHCSNTAGNSSNGNCLCRCGIYGDNVICAIIGILCKSIFLSVDINLRGVCLILSYVDIHAGYIRRNCKFE